MSAESQNSKRLAKNTLLLYFRMLFLMTVSLYTSRVILNALGIDDYGIYNVVGGVVTMFTMLSGSLTAAIQRFITYELGTGNIKQLNKIFSSAVTIQIGIAGIIVIVAETLGLWFINTQLIIPEERLYAANWCYQFSIITFAINLISVPYNATIIAHEKMSAFAYISIFEAVGKLVIAFCISINPIDRLIFYGMMVAVLAGCVRLIYSTYCKRHFEEARYHFSWDKCLLKQMFSFAGWNFIGSSAAILRDHGGNIVLNMFFGPAINAARAIAVKINSVVTGFVLNFMIALNPQITKSYASGNSDYMFKLMFQGARFSFYLLLLLSTPVLLNTHYLLALWLKLVPEHTVLFVQLTLILAMHECLATPLITGMLATGKIRNYQIWAGGLNLMNLPVTYICLRVGCFPEVIVVVAILLSFAVQGVRLYMLKKMIGLPIRVYLKSVYLNIMLVAVVSYPLLYVVNSIFTEGIYGFFIISVFSVFTTTAAILYIGCNKTERALVLTRAKSFYDSKIRHKS